MAFLRKVLVHPELLVAGVGEKVVFRGRPWLGIGMNLGYGLTLFVGGIGFLVIDSRAIFSTPLTMAMVLVLIVFGGILLVQAGNGLRGRILEVNSIGLRFSIGRHLKWDVRWQDIRAIGTSAFGGRYPRTGFFVRTEAGVRHVNNRDQLGPRSVLRKAFREVAQRADRPSTLLEDVLGWATDMGLSFGTPTQGSPFVHGTLEGRWHEASRGRSGLRFFAKASLVALLAGLGMLGVFKLLPSAPTLGAAAALLISGPLFAGVGYATHRMTLVGIRFDAHGISVRFPSGSTRSASWGNVRNLGYVASSGVIVIGFEGVSHSWMGTFPPGLGFAVGQAFAASRGPLTP